MVYLNRAINTQITDTLAQGRSILLLGPRQTGKTTLMNHIDADLLTISFIDPRTRLRYEIDPSALSDEIAALAEQHPSKPVVIIDEVQKVPDIMDVAQSLIDRDLAQLILTGSSARKLRHGKHINLLPGRVIPLHMDTLSISEIPASQLNLEHLLFYGSLPQILLAASEDEKETLLEAYVSIYLEEEVRAEALVRNLAGFARFLSLAASESGYITNQTKLSQRIGVAHTTIASYYKILEDCLIVERIEPVIHSKTRHRLNKTQKHIFFDLGVRRLAANEGLRISPKEKGHVFEQFITLELLKLARLQARRTKIKYWHDPGGPEVDCVIETPERLIPVEVKLTDRPTLADAKHVNLFLSEYDEASVGYIICQAPQRMKLTDNIYALPWQQLMEVFNPIS